MLLLAVLAAFDTEGWYTIQDTQGIVVHHAMPFWTFLGESHTQYDVLRLLLSKGYKIQLLSIPGTLNSDSNGYTTYNKHYITEGAVCCRCWSCTVSVHSGLLPCTE